MYIRKVWKLKFFIALLVGGAPMSYASSLDENCEKKWISSSAQFINQVNNDYAGLLQQWEGLKNECEGSIFYEARKAFLYAFLDQPEKALTTIKNIEKKTKDNYLVDLVKIQIDSKEYLLKDHLDNEKLKEIENKYAKYVNKYKDRSEGYAQLGGIQLLIGKHAEALINLNKAEKLATEHQFQSGLYRNLSIAYFENKNYQEAYDAASKAINFQKSMTDDKYFMYSLAKTEANLGMFEDAQNALRVIAAKIPNIKSDPEFMEAVNYVFHKMENNKP